MKNLVKPKFRYDLKSQIIKAGFKNQTEFADAVGVGLPRLSRIIRAWEFPSIALQGKMAKVLGIGLNELNQLL